MHTVYIAMRAIGGIIILYEISRWVMEKPGNSYTEPPESRNQPKTIVDLRQEFRDRLPNSVYSTFQRGVSHQLSGRYDLARIEYGKLERIPRRDGSTFNLRAVSKTLQHNWDLLKRSENAKK